MTEIGIADAGRDHEIVVKNTTLAHHRGPTRHVDMVAAEDDACIRWRPRMDRIDAAISADDNAAVAT